MEFTYACSTIELLTCGRVIRFLMIFCARTRVERSSGGNGRWRVQDKDTRTWWTQLESKEVFNSDLRLILSTRSSGGITRASTNTGPKMTHIQIRGTSMWDDIIPFCLYRYPIFNDRWSNGICNNTTLGLWASFYGTKPQRRPQWMNTTCIFSVVLVPFKNIGIFSSIQFQEPKV